ncbi:hypothetical protein HHI36_012983 [Cryptolaemus montrouzieri]|uniref:PiggyBac transposable element-derived protein domain-containing protein n=1 Tax=Cryptolaemus montrouzieri TaxID=559131 RepID=A0ABD2NG59_9CUCU
MAYNLRRMTVAESLRVEDEDDAAVDQGLASESEYDISEQSEDSDEYSASESEIDDHEMALGWENAALSQRLLESRARGRPIARLRDQLSDVNPIYTPGPAGPAVNVTTIEQFCDFLFTFNIIHMLVEHTYEQIEEHCASLIDIGADTQT